jgi:hypothetical protein
MDFDVDGLSDSELAKLSKAVAERLQRRKVLAAGAGAAVGGSFLAGQETARADPQTTQSGTFGDGDEDWNVQDIDANHVASNSVTTGSLVDASSQNSYDVDDLAGGGSNVASDSSRDLFTTSSISVTVGSSGADYSSIQAALDDIPFLLYDSVSIDVASGFDASTEDILVDMTHAGPASVSGRGFEHKVEVVGDTATPSNNPVGSVVVDGFQGGFIGFDGFDFQGDNPHDNDTVVVAAYHTDALHLQNCEWSGGTNGILSYGKSHINVQDCDLGSSLTGDGLTVKHQGGIEEQRVGNGVSGSVGGYAYVPTSGIIQTVRSTSTLSGGSGLVDPDTGRGGLVLDESDTNQAQFLGGAPYMFDKFGINQNQVYVQGTAPSSPSTGDIWIDNDG